MELPVESPFVSWLPTSATLVPSAALKPPAEDRLSVPGAVTELTAQVPVAVPVPDAMDQPVKPVSNDPFETTSVVAAMDNDVKKSAANSTASCLLRCRLLNMIGLLNEVLTAVVASADA